MGSDASVFIVFDSEFAPSFLRSSLSQGHRRHRQTPLPGRSCIVHLSSAITFRERFSFLHSFLVGRNRLGACPSSPWASIQQHSLPEVLGFPLRRPSWSIG